MKLLEQFSSEFDSNINIVFFGCVIALIIVLMASFGCLYALSLNLPTAVVIIFLIGLLLFAIQSYDAVCALLSLSRFITKLLVFSEGLELIIVPNRRLFFRNINIESAVVVKKRSNLFKKILPKSSELVELVINNQKYFISLSSEDAKKLCN